MLGASKLIAFVATAGSERAKRFYRDILGLSLLADSPFALEFDSAGTMLRIAKVDRVEPAPFTVLGWDVADIRLSIADLAKKGVQFERFPGMAQDDLGVWQAPNGTFVAWFRDPDGNLLSLTEFRTAE